MICTPIGRPDVVNAALIETAGCSVKFHGTVKADVLERMLGIVAGRAALRREGRDRRGRRDQVVDLAEQQRGEPAQLHALVEAADRLDAGELRAAFGPFARVGMDLGALLRRQRLDVAP